MASMTPRISRYKGPGNDVSQETAMSILRITKLEHVELLRNIDQVLTAFGFQGYRWEQIRIEERRSIRATIIQNNSSIRDWMDGSRWGDEKPEDWEEIINPALISPTGDLLYGIIRTRLYMLKKRHNKTARQANSGENITPGSGPERRRGRTSASTRAARPGDTRGSNSCDPNAEGPLMLSAAKVRVTRDDGREFVGMLSQFSIEGRQGLVDEIDVRFQLSFEKFEGVMEEGLDFAPGEETLWVVSKDIDHMQPVLGADGWFNSILAERFGEKAEYIDWKISRP